MSNLDSHRLHGNLVALKFPSIFYTKENIAILCCVHYLESACVLNLCYACSPAMGAVQYRV